MNKAVKTILTLSLLVFSSGCPDRESVPEKDMLAAKDSDRHLKKQLEQANAKNEQLTKQVQVLTGLKSDISIKDVYDLQGIQIAKHSDFYDKDKDGKKEKLIVYVQPMDAQNDVIKASGAVDVQLWDLNKDDADALITEWHVKPDELKKLWFATIVKTSYRLMFDVTDAINDIKDPLTVKVTFTDYLSGKVFTEQTVIKP